MKRKRKKLQKLPACPCCGEKRHATELKTMLKKVLQIEGRSEFFSEKEQLLSLVNRSFGWACDVCLREEKAIVADHQVQFISPIHWPNMAWYDHLKTCRTCGEEFVFRKEEQKYWYEELQFIVWSHPVNCHACRRDIRNQKEQQKQLSSLLNKGIDHLSDEELDEVIDIYELWKKPQRVSYYRALKRKLEKKQGRK